MSFSLNLMNQLCQLYSLALFKERPTLQIFYLVRINPLLVAHFLFKHFLPFSKFNFDYFWSNLTSYWRCSILVANSKLILFNQLKLLFNLIFLYSKLLMVTCFNKMWCFKEFAAQMIEINYHLLLQYLNSFVRFLAVKVGSLDLNYLKSHHFSYF